MTKTEKFSLIKEKISACILCDKLIQCRIKTVPGEGDLDARVAFIGHSPGQNENEQGRPFVGESGKLLNNIIKACGWEREQVFIVNPIACHPPGNRNPTEKELTNCRGFFQMQLNLVNPQYLVCLGAVAIRAVFGREISVTSLRGRLHEIDGKKVLVTNHPSHVLRSDGKEIKERKDKIWADFTLLLEEIKNDQGRCQDA